MKTRFIGDMHGNMGRYLFITDGCDRSIQVGDFGAGFVELPTLADSHRFIRGNHDDPAACRSHPNWIKDVSTENDMFFLGGAWSIDYEHRIPGVSWWVDEELSWSELGAAINLYEEVKPRIMVTHDGPHDIMKKMFPFMDRSSRTQNALQTMLDIHKPETWLFGHWHQNRDEVHENTRFICLDEWAFIDLDV